MRGKTNIFQIVAQPDMMQAYICVESPFRAFLGMSNCYGGDFFGISNFLSRVQKPRI